MFRWLKQLKCRKQYKHCSQCDKRLNEWFIDKDEFTGKLSMWCCTLAGGCGWISPWLSHNDS